MDCRIFSKDDLKLCVDVEKVVERGLEGLEATEGALEVRGLIDWVFWPVVEAFRRPHTCLEVGSMMDNQSRSV